MKIRQQWSARPLTTFVGVLSLLVTLHIGGTAAMAEYPEKSIKVIIGFSAGGGADTFARTVGKYAEKYIGAKFDFIYKKGGGGTVAVNEMLHNAKADGYTVAVGILPHQVIPTQVSDVGYQPSDVNWMATFAMIPNGVYVKADSPYKTLSDVIAAAKAKPGKVKAAVPGPRSGNTLFFRRWLEASNIDIAEIHYGGGSKMYKALLGRETELMITNANWIVRQPDELRLLALASEARFPLATDVPTFRELGLDLIDSSVRAIIAPGKMPADVAKHLVDGLGKMAADPAFIADMSKIGLVVGFRDDKATNAFVADYVSNNGATFEKLRNQNN